MAKYCVLKPWMQIVVYSDFKMYFMLNILSWSFYTTYQKVTLQINQPLVKIGADILNAKVGRP